MYVRARSGRSKSPEACVASVSVGWRAKKVKGTGFSESFPREKWGESQTTKKGGVGGSRTIFRAGKTPKIPFL